MTKNNFKIGRSSSYVPTATGIPNVVAGQGIKSNLISQISSAIDRKSIKSSPDYLVKETIRGTTISINKESIFGYGTSPLTAKMIAVNKSKYGESPSLEYRVYVSCGTVNLQVPQINGKYIDEPDSNNGLPYLLLNSNGYVVVVVEADNTKPFPAKNVSIEFKSGNNPLIYESSGTKGYYPLASVRKSGEGFNFSSISRGNLKVSRLKVYQNDAIWTWSAYGY